MGGVPAIGLPETEKKPIVPLKRRFAAVALSVTVSRLELPAGWRKKAPLCSPKDTSP